MFCTPDFPRAAGPRDEGVHNKQNTSIYVTMAQFLMENFDKSGLEKFDKQKIDECQCIHFIVISIAMLTAHAILFLHVPI